MTASTCIIDAGFGNLFSLTQALRRLGREATVSDDPGVILAADQVLLPGVGAFGDACAELDRRGLREPIHEYVASGKPFFGICLGMQLLFADSEEAPDARGLGLIPGTVKRFRPEDPTLKVPHMGWNEVTWREGSSLGQKLHRQGYFYFVHSYYCAPANEAHVAGGCDYDGSFCASIEAGNVFGVQFHPEKSQHEGARLLEAFFEYAGSR